MPFETRLALLPVVLAQGSRSETREFTVSLTVQTVVTVSPAGLTMDWSLAPAAALGQGEARFRIDYRDPYGTSRTYTFSVPVAASVPLVQLEPSRSVRPGLPVRDLSQVAGVTFHIGPGGTSVILQPVFAWEIQVLERLFLNVAVDPAGPVAYLPVPEAVGQSRRVVQAVLPAATATAVIGAQAQVPQPEAGLAASPQAAGFPPLSADTGLVQGQVEASFYLEQPGGAVGALQAVLPFWTPLGLYPPVSVAPGSVAPPAPRPGSASMAVPAQSVWQGLADLLALRGALQGGGSTRELRAEAALLLTAVATSPQPVSVAVASPGRTVVLPLFAGSGQEVHALSGSLTLPPGTPRVASVHFSLSPLAAQLPPGHPEGPVQVQGSWQAEVVYAGYGGTLQVARFSQPLNLAVPLAVPPPPGVPVAGRVATAQGLLGPTQWEYQPVPRQLVLSAALNLAVWVTVDQTVELAIA